MFREREKTIEKGSVLLQTLLSFCSLHITIFLLKHDAIPHTKSINFNQYIYISYLILPIWYLLLDQFRMGRMLQKKLYTKIFFHYTVVISIGIATLFVFIHLMEFKISTPICLLSFAIMNLLVLYIYKAFVHKTMKFLKGRGYNHRHIAIIADNNSTNFIDQIINTKDWGYDLHIIVTNSETIKNKFQHICSIRSEIIPICEVIDKEVIDEVIYCKRDFNQDKIRAYINQCSEVGITFRVHSELINIAGAHSTISYVNKFPFINFIYTPDNYLALKIKSAIDYIGAALILVAISPVLLVIALAIKLDDGGPIFFKQIRVGRNGRLFYCWKFRTMLINAEELKDALMEKNEQEGPVFKMKNDPRITKIGHFLRKTSLDELPQFLNVLKGEMSIVGPRPPIPSEVENYERWQRRRLSMKPGITCIWQVSGRNNIPFDQWMRMDMHYIDSWSIELDILLILRTIKIMLVKDGQ